MCNRNSDSKKEENVPGLFKGPCLHCNRNGKKIQQRGDVISSQGDDKMDTLLPVVRVSGPREVLLRINLYINLQFLREQLSAQSTHYCSF